MLLAPGLYVIRRPTEAGVGWHFAIADFGNVLGRVKIEDLLRSPHPVVIIEHSPPEGLRYEVYYDGLGVEWQVLEPPLVIDAVVARARLGKVATDPEWRFGDNNCEDVVWFIATGKKRSPQRENVGAALGIGALVWLFGTRSGRRFLWG